MAYLQGQEQNWWAHRTTWGEVWGKNFWRQGVWQRKSLEGYPNRCQIIMLPLNEKKLWSVPSPPYQQRSETQKKQWFSQYSKTGQSKAPQESTQLWADWHKSSQANGNVWVGEVQARAHPSNGRTCISSSIFQFSIPPPCVLKRLSAYGANDKHFKEKQNSKIEGHFPWHINSTGSTSISPPISAYGVKGSDALDKTPHP